MAVTTFSEFIKGYKSEAKTEYLYNSVFAPLIPKDKLLDARFGAVKQREISIVGGTVPYNGKYPNNAQGAKINVNWVDYNYDYDGAFNFSDDSLEEIQSFIQGSEPSIFVGVKSYIGRTFAVETDMLCASTYYNQIPEANKLKGAFDAGFYAGLDAIDKSLTNAKVSRNHIVYVWVNASTYEKQAAEARENHILANSTTMEIEQGGLVIKKDVLKYGRFIIIPVADDILVDKVDLLDGVSEGQEAGGVVVAEDAKQIQALIIPEGAGFVDNQYVTSNIWYNPMLDLGEIGEVDSNITDLIGDFRINRVGANPEADAFAIKGRIRNGRSLYDINKKYCFSVEANA